MATYTKADLGRDIILTSGTKATMCGTIYFAAGRYMNNPYGANTKVFTELCVYHGYVDLAKLYYGVKYSPSVPGWPEIGPDDPDNAIKLTRLVKFLWSLEILRDANA